jgi:hypothetical protein
MKWLMYIGVTLHALGLVACLASRVARYETKLEECNRKAQTLQDSIDCENAERLDAGRPLRDGGSK